MVDVNKITELRDGLKRFYGSYKRVSEKAEVSTEMVRLVLLGERTSGKVILAAAASLVELEMEELEMRRQIDADLEKIRSLRPSHFIQAAVTA